VIRPELGETTNRYQLSRNPKLATPTSPFSHPEYTTVSTAATAPATPTKADDRPRFGSMFSKNVELIVAILLGLVSIVTAYASFQAALYDSTMAGKYATANTLSTQAESLYLESNQTYIQDVQLYDSITALKIEIDSDDAETAFLAQAKYDALTFQSVSEELAAAMTEAEAQDEAEPDFYHSPFDTDAYNDYLYSDYQTTNADSEAARTEGDEANSLSDKLTLYTVLMSISLFLLGIAAVVRGLRTQLILGSVAVVIFGISAVLTALIPAVSL